MILQRLAEHYDRIEADLARPGYSRQKVSFCIVIEPDGTLNSFDDLRRLEGKTLRPQTLDVPGQSKPSGSGLNPCFLWDRIDYLLGFSPDPEKQERAVSAFFAFQQAHLAQEASLRHPAFSAVCAFLRQWTPQQAQAYAAELSEKATHFGVFRLTGAHSYVHELVQAADTEAESIAAEASAMCLVSGEVGPIARLHEPKIKGVADAQTGGALLVSFNASASTSYGKEQSFNAPVGRAITFKYANALNHLLDTRRIGLGDATIVYWADHDATPFEDAFAQVLSGPQEVTSEEDQRRVDEARLLLVQLRNGIPYTPVTRDERPTRFFILGLSPNASRLSVRLWIEADAAVLASRLSSHLRDLALAGSRDDRLLTLRRIAAVTGRAEYDPKGKIKGFDTKAVSPQLVGDLTRAVLTGSAYPQSLLATMVRRIRSDGAVDFSRVSAIKACLVRNSRLRGAPLEVPVQLDSQAMDVAYRCGRLFALLEKAQTDSLGGDLNSTIKDRYFSSASATPALVFPRLFRLNVHHLAKLETPSKIFYERLIGATMVAPFQWPKQLTLEEQGRFIVGYFQQRQDLYTKREKAPQEEALSA